MTDLQLTRKSTDPAAPQKWDPVAPEHGTKQTVDLQRITHIGAPLPPPVMRQLQQGYGNHAVSQLMQPKLKVGPADDPYEREADRVADDVMRSPALPVQTPVQRQTEEEELLTKRVVQREPEEEEILTKRVVQRQADEDEILTKKLAPPIVNRTSANENPNTGFETDASFDRSLSAARGGGSPLSSDLRTDLEPKFGADFSDVRVHTDSRSADLNRQINAQAFTHGSDIFFGAGKYNPGSGSGKHLIAHELTHTVQQGAAGPQLKRLSATNAPQPAPLETQPKSVMAHTSQSTVQRAPLIADAQQAFRTAIVANSNYTQYGQWVNQFMPTAHQQKLVKLSGWFSRLGRSIAGLFKRKSTERSPADKLKDFVRAYLLAEYAARLKPLDDDTALSETEKNTKRDEKYFPKAIEARDKYAPLIKKGVAAPETQSFLASQGFQGEVTVTEAQRETENAKGPRIDVRSTFLAGKILGRPYRGHLFIVYTNAEGKQWYFRGGPGDGGKTVADMGEYAPGTIDWDPSAPAKVIMRGPAAAEKLDRLIEAASVIDDMNVPYVSDKWKGLKFSGENCNATAWTILDRAGVPKGKPSGIHPGWGHTLGTFLGEGDEMAPEEVEGEGVVQEICSDDDTEPVYGDRLKYEKIGELPDETPVTRTLVSGDMAKIKAEDGITGWVVDTNLITPVARETGRAFKISGESDRIIVTYELEDMRQSNSVYLSGGDKVEVLDADFDPSNAELSLVKVRVTVDDDEEIVRVMSTDLTPLSDNESSSSSTIKSRMFTVKGEPGDLVGTMKEDLTGTGDLALAGGDIVELLSEFDPASDEATMVKVRYTEEDNEYIFWVNSADLVAMEDQISVETQPTEQRELPEKEVETGGVLGKIKHLKTLEPDVTFYKLVETDQVGNLADIGDLIQNHFDKLKKWFAEEDIWNAINEFDLL